MKTRRPKGTPAQASHLRAVQYTDYDKWHWRVGRSIGRTIYAVRDTNEAASDNDVCIGMLDTPELAAEAVRCHNLDIDIRNSK